MLLAEMLVLTHNRRSPGALEPRPRLLTTLHSRCFMAGSKSTLTAARLRELLHYDPDTGLFTRIKSTGTAKFGDLAGCIRPDGYVFISVDGVQRLGHLLAWLYVNGEWCKHEVDHKDRDRSNNAYSNLRECSGGISNQHNISTVSPSKCGLRGAHFHKASGRWRSSIRVFGKIVPLGWFGSAQEAHKVYIEAKRRLHLGCTI